MATNHIVRKAVFKPEDYNPAPAEKLIGLKYTVLTSEKVVAELPVTQRITQPFGVLHGGISVVFAESLASVGSALNIDLTRNVAVGLEINANHVSPGVVGDTLIGTAVPLNIGKRNQVWTIDIRSKASSRLVCTSRCTTAVIPRAQLGLSSEAKLEDLPISSQTGKVSSKL
jgi:1,4-dihydroxy-2-naphthoyl-CoA hydrolase